LEARIGGGYDGTYSHGLEIGFGPKRVKLWLSFG
jgi:hypothetical protein